MPASTTRRRQMIQMPKLIIQSRKAQIGPGMEVNRILPYYLQRMVGPFIFMDHAGPIRTQPESLHAMDVLPHPHIGLSTVTYLFRGEVTHRDSLGVEQVIVPGEVNWMTAGRGISHSERFEHPEALKGGLEMLQTWVALPEKNEEDAPSFTNYKPEQLPVFTDKGVWWRLVAGEAFGERSHVNTLSPLMYLHAELEKGALFALPAQYTERGVYILRGALACDGISYPAGNLIVFHQSEQPLLRAMEKCTMMILGGEPLGERHIWWNFVSSRKSRIEQAKADWQSGIISLPPMDDEEFIPLPPDHRRKSDDAVPPPEALS